VARCFGSERTLLWAKRRIDDAVRETQLGVCVRVQAVRWPPLSTTDLVVTGVDRDAQQPAAQPARWTAERPQASERTEQRVLRCVSSILSVAKRAVADVVHLALEGLNQRVERRDIASLGSVQRVFERGRLGLHRAMLPSGRLRYGTWAVSVLRWLPSVLLLLPWLVGSQAPSNADRIRDVAGPNTFSLFDWETQHVAADLGPLISRLIAPSHPDDADAATLRAYFGDRSTRDQWRPAAQAAIERLVNQAYTDDGLKQHQPLPTAGLFPPVLTVVTPPPNVLVISPRADIRVVDSQVLQPMDVAAQERLEASADSTGISSLVAPIGGLATYPSMVLDDDSAQRVLASVAHEWMHQYLIFYPLGQGYWNSQETREINETTAEMVGQEVGTQIASAEGLGLPPPTNQPATPAPARAAFDFTMFMRETRQQTEQLLAGGRVDDAEAYMRNRRDELQQHGYYIRKLNQAYFALYGSYGESFAASPANPIPGLLHKLRDQSSTLGEFAVKVRGITTVAELRQAAG